MLGLGLGFISLFGLLCLLLWVIAILDIVRSRFADDTTKVVWILLVIFLPVLGTILYFLIGRQQRIY